MRRRVDAANELAVPADHLDAARMAKIKPLLGTGRALDVSRLEQDVKLMRDSPHDLDSFGRVCRNPREGDHRRQNRQCLHLLAAFL